MARPQDPDEILNGVLDIDDLDVHDGAGIAARERLMEAERDGYVAQIDAELQRDQAQPNQRLREIDAAIAPEQKDLERRIEHHAPSVDRAAAWREAGIRERVFALDLPTPLRRLVLALLAMVDFYVFALAVAEAQEVAASITEPLFLVGGVLGCAVFGVGLLLARVVKRAFYARAQTQMLQNTYRGQINGVDRRRLTPVKEPEWLLMILLGALFVTLCSFAFAIRWQAMDPTENPNVVVFMSLLPLIGLAVEMVMYDPSVVEASRQSMRHRRLLHQRDAEYATLRELQAQAALERKRLIELYRLAFARWELRLADMGRGRPPAEGGSATGSPIDPRPGAPIPPGNGAGTGDAAAGDRLGGTGV